MPHLIAKSNASKHFSRDRCLGGAGLCSGAQECCLKALLGKRSRRIAAVGTHTQDVTRHFMQAVLVFYVLQNTREQGVGNRLPAHSKQTRRHPGCILSSGRSHHCAKILEQCALQLEVSVISKGYAEVQSAEKALCEANFSPVGHTTKTFFLAWCKGIDMNRTNERQN